MASVTHWLVCKELFQLFLSKAQSHLMKKSGYLHTMGASFLFDTSLSSLKIITIHDMGDTRSWGEMYVMSHLDFTQILKGET